MLGLPVLHYLLEFAQIHVHWSLTPSNHLILCCPLPLSPSIFPSIRVFSNELALHVRWPKYWSFSFSPSNEYSGLISFRMDWFNLLTVQGTFKSLLQHHIPKALILWHSAFFRFSQQEYWSWFAIPFSSGPYFVRPLHYDLSVLGGPAGHGS